MCERVQQQCRKECEAIARFDEIGKELGISDDILLTIAEDIKGVSVLFIENFLM